MDGNLQKGNRQKILQETNIAAFILICTESNNYMDIVHLLLPVIWAICVQTSPMSAVVWSVT